MEDGVGDFRGRGWRDWTGTVVFVVVAAAQAVPWEAAAGQAVAVSAEQRLSPAPQPFPLVESWLAINPKDPSNLLASAMSVTAEESVVYGSWDGGHTWSRAKTPGGSVFPGGDPAVSFGADGKAWFATTDHFKIWRSVDGGGTWAAASWSGAGHAYDRDWLTAGPPTEEGGPPTLYGMVRRDPEPGEGGRPVLEVAVSRDGGSTFTSDAVVLDSGYINVVMPPVVRPDGMVVLPLLVNYGRVPGNREMYRGRRLVLVSGGGGRTWSEHAVAENIQFGNSIGDQAMKGLGIGSLAVDGSGGEFDGALYMAWASVLDDRVQILLSRSSDGGVTWSQPVRVNDGGLRSNHSLATVAVNRDGVVAVLWDDRRDDPSDQCFRPYVAISADGGRTFGPNRAISDRPTCPGGGRWLNGGDTNGLVALPDGSFRATWTAGQGRDLSIWTGVVHPSAGL